MGKSGICLALLAALLMCGVASAQEAENAVSSEDLASLLSQTQAELQKATQRIDELEQKVGGIQGTMDKTGQDVYSLSTQLKQIEVGSRDIKEAPGVVFTPYGYIKVDLVYDDTRTSGTSATAFVMPEAAGFGSDRHYTITARQTRFGVNIAGPDIGEGTSAGKIEVDFYAPSSVENKAELMMRHAYWQLTYPTWNILVGQTWEVMSPAFPNTLNYAYLALSGNPGYRKPMIRYERKDAVWGDKTLQTDVALVRGIGTTLRSTTYLDDEATDAGIPDIQARVGLTSPTKHGRPVKVGISGHFGREEYDPVVAGVVVSGKGTLYSTYSGNVDFSVPLAESFDFNGEFWSGRNLDGYMGGIGQGVNLALAKPVDAIGGWGQLCYHPDPKWLFTAGAGIDDPQNNDISAGGRTRNATYFTNCIYNINKQTLVGVELSYQDTEWKNSADGDNIRVQSSLQFNF